MSNSFVTPWTVACQAPLSTGFPRQEYWNGLPFPSPGDLSDPGLEPASPALAGDSLPLSHLGSPLIQLVSVIAAFVFLRNYVLAHALVPLHLLLSVLCSFTISFKPLLNVTFSSRPPNQLS